MRSVNFHVFVLAALIAFFSIAVSANSCSGGVQACCASASVSCSGNVCKACCGNRCGCWNWRSSTCSSQRTPCVDLNNPDFATVNGQCTAGAGNSNTGVVSSGGSTGGSTVSSGTASNTGGSTTTTTSSQSSFCASLGSNTFWRRIFGCP